MRKTRSQSELVSAPVTCYLIPPINKSYIDVDGIRTATPHVEIPIPASEDLCVAEKTHWRDCIQARIDRRIEAITADEPGLMDRIKREARGRALTSLGLAGFQAELDRIAEQKDALDKRDRQARRAMLARIRGG